MKLHYWIIALGIYMLAMGILGYIRTGSPTALFVNGGIAVATIVLGYFNGGGSPLLLKITLGWVALNTIMLTYLTFKRIAAHSQARAGSEFIFGSMALFSLVVAILLIREVMRGLRS
ncbi:MAG: hypothetical protein IT585_14665 [candidate division Zixibacteria bacterium]|nr:hypothetical protein [candidate division Zixibacteria bacterium]